MISAAMALLLACVQGPLVWNWVNPLPGQLQITSPFGRRGHQMHPGIDLYALVGTPVAAVADGVVAAVGYNELNGNFITVDHPDGVTSYYCHLSRILVLVGTIVVQGRVIGKSGNTGLSTGPHLHLGAYRRNKVFNPLYLLEEQ